MMKEITREVNEQPAAKLIAKGKSAMSDIDLFATLIGGYKAFDKAKTILNAVNYRYDKLSELSGLDLKKLGLTWVESAKIMTAFEISRRKAMQSAEEFFTIRASRDIQAIMNPLLSNLQHEEFWCIFVNRSNKLISKERISQGGISGTVTDIRIIFKKAVDLLASGIIVCHNHPSGNLNPSESDTKITKRIQDAGAIMDVQLLDHIIITNSEYYSFADNGLI